MTRAILTASLALLLGLIGAAQAQPAGPVASEQARFKVTTVASGLEHPWGLAFLPDGSMLVTERPGRLRWVSASGQMSEPLDGVPEVYASGQGGLLDVAVAPDFATSRMIYMCHAARVADGALTRVVRARLDGSPQPTGLRNLELVIDAGPPSRGSNHWGCRIVFDVQGKLLVSTGDRFSVKMRAQRLDDLAGKTLRLEPHGAPAAGNPFIGRQDARPEIWTLGHRNPQGLAFHPSTGTLWEAEFGPLEGDEVNLIRGGANYGWPLVVYGRDYDGSRIGVAQPQPGMTDPIKVWTQVISPSGIAFYTGNDFPGWRNSLFLAALRPPGLVRLSTDGDRITGEERLLWDTVRMRTVKQGPDGRLYILTDKGSRDSILRIDPA